MSLPPPPPGAVPVEQPAVTPTQAHVGLPPPPPGAVPVLGATKPQIAGPQPDLIRTTQYEKRIEDVSKKYNLDPNWIRAIHSIEDNTDDPYQLSHDDTGLKGDDAHAVGEMQTLPSTFRSYEGSKANLYDPNLQFDAGAHYFSDLLHQYGGNVDAALEAYNEGPGSVAKGLHVPAYVKSVRDQYDNALRDGYGLTAPAFGKKLTQGTPPKPPPLPKGWTPAGGVGSTDQPNFTRDRYIEALNQTIGDAGTGLENSANFLTSAAFNRLTPAEQQATKAILNSGPVKNLGDGLSRIGQFMDILSWDQFNAYMEDYATGGHKNSHAVNAALELVLNDPKGSAQFLGMMQSKYGLGTREGVARWMSRPGLREQLANIGKHDDTNLYAALVAGLYADNARMIVNAPNVAGLENFLGEWFNPAWKLIPAGGTFVRGVSHEMMENARSGSQIEQHIAKVIDDRTESARMFANRFHKMAKRFGIKGELDHAYYTRGQADAQNQAAMLLGQEHRMGATSPAGRNAILREHDRFSNQQMTLHQEKSTPGEEPHFDPLTQTTSMHKGPAPGPWANYNFAAHEKAPTIIKKGAEADTFLPPGGQAETWKELYKTATGPNRKPGQIAALLSMLGEEPKVASAFEVALEDRIAKIPKGARAKELRDTIMRRALGRYADQQSLRSVEYQNAKGKTIEVVFPGKDGKGTVKPLTRDHTMQGGFTTHQRAENSGFILNEFEGITKTMSPENTAQFVENRMSRTGIYKPDPTEAQAQQGGMSLAKIFKGVGGLGPGTGLKDQFVNIQEGLDKGKEINPDFDAAVPVIKQMTRQIQFQNYWRFGMKYAQPLDYRKYIMAGTGGFVRVIPRISLAGGPATYKSWNEWLEAETLQELQHGDHPDYPISRFQQLSDVKNIKGPGGEMTSQLEVAKETIKHSIVDKVKKAFNDIHTDPKTGVPNQTFNTGDDVAIPEFNGYTIPTEVRDAMIDGHPVFQDGREKVRPDIWSQDAREQNGWENTLEFTSNMFRSGLFATVLYHPFKNLAKIGLIFGKMNPIDMAQAMFSPDTIELTYPGLLKEAEDLGITAKRMRAGAPGTKALLRNKLAEPPRKGGGPQAIAAEKARSMGDFAKYVTGMGTSDRIKVMQNAFKNVQDPNHSPFKNTWSVIQKVWYNSDLGNQEWVFGVYEDVFAALSFKNLRNELLNKGRSYEDATHEAAREVQRQLGDAGNISDKERRLGLDRMTWFYGWTRSQWKLWSRMQERPIKAAVGIPNAVTTANQNKPDVDDPAALRDSIVVHQGDNQYAISLGGPEHKMASWLGLSYAPIGGRQASFQDWQHFVSSDAAYSVSPVMRGIYQGLMTGVNKAEEPSDLGSLYDKDVPPQDQLLQGAQQFGKGLVPTIGPAVAGAKESRGLTLLNLTGYAAKKLDPHGERQRKILEAAYRKALNESLAASRGDPARQSDAIQRYGPKIFEQEQKKAPQ